MKIDKRRTKENVAKLKQYVCWIDEYFYNLDKVKVTLETTKVVLEHTGTGCKVEDTEIVERFTNKNSAIVRNTKDYAIRDAKRLGNELLVLVKNHKALNTKLDEYLIISYQTFLKNMVASYLNNMYGFVHGRDYSNTLLLLGYEDITVTEDFKVTITYVYKDYQSQAIVDFKTNILAMINDGIQGVDVLYSDWYDFKKYIPEYQLKLLRTKVEESISYMVKNICNYQDDYVFTTFYDVRFDGGADIVNFILNTDLISNNNYKKIDRLSGTYGYPSFGALDKAFTDKLESMVKQAKLLLKSVDLKSDMFKDFLITASEQLVCDKDALNNTFIYPKITLNDCEVKLSLVAILANGKKIPLGDYSISFAEYSYYTLYKTVEPNLITFINMLLRVN